MNAKRLAKIYAKCFPDDAHVWSAEAIEQFAQGAGCRVFEARHGGLFWRNTALEGEIISVFVEPMMREQGIATGLIERVFSFAREQGVATVFLEVSVEKKHAQNLYEKFGFRSVGKRKGYYLKRDGRRVDALTMRIDLATQI